jgi:hypothetical protein
VLDSFSLDLDSFEMLECDGEEARVELQLIERTGEGAVLDIPGL